MNVSTDSSGSRKEPLSAVVNSGMNMRVPQQAEQLSTLWCSANIQRNYSVTPFQLTPF